MTLYEVAGGAVTLALVIAVASVAVYNRVLHPLLLRRAEKRRRDDYWATLEFNRFQREDWQALMRQQRQVVAEIEKHKHVLLAKRAQLRRRDEYGIVDETPWAEHRRYFIAHVLARRCRVLGRESAHELPQLIEAVLDGHAIPDPPRPTMLSLPERPYALEAESQVARSLPGEGWETATKRHRNGRVDTTARRGDVNVVLHALPAGADVDVGAVRAILAARESNAATHAALVWSGRYTDEARALARQERVLLLKPDQVSDLLGILAARR